MKGENTNRMKTNIDKKNICDSIFLLQPSRPILCTTKNENLSDHVAPFGWVMPVSFNPPMVGMALLNSPEKQHTLINIERDGEFVVNIPDMNIVDKLVETSYATKNNENKFDRSGFTSIPSKQVKPVSIGECRAHLECKVSEIIVSGDHNLVVGNVVWAVFDNEAFSSDLLIKLENFEPAFNVKHYKMKDYQAHVFSSHKGTRIIEVDYSKQNR